MQQTKEEHKPRQTAEYFREYRKKNRERLNMQRRLWLSEKPQRYARKAAKWSRENRDKQAAYSRLYEALKKGTIAKTPCSCGNPDVIAFYNDYNDISTVEWLCRYCHSKKREAIKNDVN